MIYKPITGAEPLGGFFKRIAVSAPLHSFFDRKWILWINALANPSNILV